MKKILFVHQASEIGGASFCLLNLLKELDRNCFEPIVMLKTPGPLVEELGKLGVEVIFFNDMTDIPYNKSILSRGAISRYKKAFKSLAQFKRLLLRGKFDVVYLNNMMLYPYLKGIYEAGCKSVIHVREHWPLNEHVLQLKTARRYVKQYADLVIAINRYSASIFENYAKNIEIVHDWIELASRHQEMPFDKIFNEDCSKLKVFLFSGGLNYIKGTLPILETFSALKGEEYRLLMLGVDSSINFGGVKNKIRKIMSRFGYTFYQKKCIDIIKGDNRIKCIPSTYYITHLMQQAYCNISYFTIPHANLSMAESISLNKVCLACKTDESLEYSGEGKLACLYEINNRQDFTDKLHYLIANYNKYLSALNSHENTISDLFEKKNNSLIFNNALKRLI